MFDIQASRVTSPKNGHKEDPLLRYIQKAPREIYKRKLIQSGLQRGGVKKGRPQSAGARTSLSLSSSSSSSSSSHGNKGASSTCVQVGADGKHMRSRFFNGHHHNSSSTSRRPMTPGTMLHMKSPESKDRASPHKALSSISKFGHMKGMLMGKSLTRSGANCSASGKSSKQEENEDKGDASGVTVVVPLLRSMNSDTDWTNFSPATGGDDFGSWDADAVPVDVDGHVDIYYDDYDEHRARSRSSRRPKSARRRGRKKKKMPRPKSAGSNRGRQQTKK
jgi:hypothetical protein